MFKHFGKTVHVKVVGVRHDCKWFTFKDGESVPDELVDAARLHGCNLVKEGEKKVDPSLDLNKDGVVDKKDAKIGSKVMNFVKSSRKRKGKKKED